jgi:hypothetical protein
MSWHETGVTYHLQTADFTTITLIKHTLVATRAKTSTSEHSPYHQCLICNQFHGPATWTLPLKFTLKQ